MAVPTALSASRSRSSRRPSSSLASPAAASCRRLCRRAVASPIGHDDWLRFGALRCRSRRHATLAAAISRLLPDGRLVARLRVRAREGLTHRLLASTPGPSTHEIGFRVVHLERPLRVNNPSFTSEPIRKLNRSRGRWGWGASCPKGHYVSSPSSAFASFRSRVSNPSVNQPYTGASSSRACCGFP